MPDFVCPTIHTNCMSLTHQFKKDYFNYLLSILLPALITAITIPFLKRYLGATVYGQFSLHYNAVLIFTTITTAWMNQSISRFYGVSENKRLFMQMTLRLSLVFQSLVFVPALAIAWFITQDGLLSLLMCTSVMAMGLQSSLMVKAQAALLSSKTIYSETIRTGGYFLCSWALLHLTSLQEIHTLFIASIIAFGASGVYLYQTIKLHLITATAESTAMTNRNAGYRQLMGQFFHYGFPLTLWFVVVYLFSYVDKLIMLNKAGGELQGNYQAMFDLFSKGFTLIISPVLISLMPLLSVAYKDGKHTEIKALLKKIILMELAGFALVTIAYYSFGSKILLLILDIPKVSLMETIGFMIISGTLIWQIAMVINKKYELKLQSGYLLLFACITLMVQLLYFYLMYARLTATTIVFGYLLSSATYLLLVALPWPRLKSIFSSTNQNNR